MQRLQLVPTTTEQKHRLPVELYEELGACLPRHDLASFARATRLTNAVATRLLYRQIIFSRNTIPEVLLQLFETLATNEDLARIVVHLEVDWSLRSKHGRNGRPAHDVHLHMVNGMAAAFVNLANLEHLSISKALYEGSVFDTPNLLFPRLREFHFYASGIELATGIGAFLQRHAANLERLSIFPLYVQLGKLEDTFRGMVHLETLRVGHLDALATLMGLSPDGEPPTSVPQEPRPSAATRAVRRIDLAAHSDDSLRRISALQTAFPNVRHLNFMRHFLFTAARADSNIQTWLGIERLGLCYCVADGETLGPRFTETLGFCARAFPEVEILDIFCDCSTMEDDKTDHWEKQSAGSLGKRLLDVVGSSMSRLQLVTFAGRAFTRNLDSPSAPFVSRRLKPSFDDVPYIPTYLL